MTRREKQKMLAFELMDPENISAADRALAQKCYRAQIRALDVELGRLMNFLDRQGLRRDTVIIVVSDHGEQFGEHGLYLHGNSLYRPVVHVPLVVSCGATKLQGSRIRRSVSLRNIAATILDCAGVSDVALDGGGSLLEMAAKEAVALPGSLVSDTAVYAHNSLEELKGGRRVPVLNLRKSRAWIGPLNLWIDGSFHLIQGPGENVEVYDVESDPQEKHDLSEVKVYAGRVSRMLAELKRFVSGQENADDVSGQEVEHE